MSPGVGDRHAERWRRHRQPTGRAAAVCLQAGEHHVAGQPRAAGDVVVHLDRGVDDSAVELRRHRRGQVKLDESQIEAPQNRGGAELERVEPHVRHPDRHRRARDGGPGGGDALDVRPPAGQATRLHGRVLDRPRPRRAQRPVLDRQPIAADGDSANRHGAATERDVLGGHSQRRRRHEMCWPLQLDAVQPRVQRQPRPPSRVVIDPHGGVHDSALWLHRQIGRHVEPEQREVDVADDGRGVQLEGGESEIGDPHRHRRSGDHRAGRGDAGRRVTSTRKFAGLERDALGPPAPDRREPRVIQQHRAAIHRQAPELDRAGAKTEVLHRQPHGRRGQERALLSGSPQLDAAEDGIERDAGARRGALVDRRRCVELPPGRAQRAARRQVERGQRRVDLPRDDRRVEAQRGELHAADPQRDR